MFDVKKIKLVVWDLDDTLWHGTISEEDVDLPDENIVFIHDLIDKGIMNSVCSKNDFDIAHSALEYAGLWDLFIFPRISWQSKGENIKLIIKDAQLRAENVLFIDDNHGNLEEAKFYNPGLMTLDASNISSLKAQMKNIPALDIEHVRLQQYKLLETRSEARERAANNLDFLRQSKICVTIIKNANNELDRTYELVQRTNQLNFTKKRSTKEELQVLLNQTDLVSGCIHVTDRYGDYGIVGFYAVRAGKLEHFLFFCRIMGMGIEQWVYAQLGYPELIVVPEVASTVNHGNAPDWINQTMNDPTIQYKVSSEQNGEKLNMLMSGGCDLMSLHYYLQDNANIDTEFDYVSPKTGQYATSMHTEFLVQSLIYNEEKKERLKKGIPFYDERTFSTRFFNKKYDIVVTSILNDCTRGLYFNESQNETLVFGDNLWPMITPEDWLALLKKGYQNVMTKEMCAEFFERYKYIGGISTERFIGNLEFIRGNLDPETLLIFTNAVELNVVLNGETDRHLRHIEINKALKSFCDRHSDNVMLIDVNEFVHSKDDLADTLRHYQRKIYFEMAQRMLSIINTRKSASLKILNQSTGTPMDRFNEALRERKQFVIYGATQQGITLYNKLKQLNPILIDEESAPSGTGVQVYTPDKLTEFCSDVNAGIKMMETPVRI